MRNAVGAQLTGDGIPLGRYRLRLSPAQLGGDFDRHYRQSRYTVRAPDAHCAVAGPRESDH